MIYINGNPLNSTLFPDNTTQVWKVPALDISDVNYIHIRWEFHHEGEFMELAQLKTLLDSYNYSSSLRIVYLPYGRQDKEVNNKATFALHTFAKLLNSLKFEEVIIHDPHSSKALELIDNSRAVYPIKELHLIQEEVRCDIVCYPDKGAVVKYGPLLNYLYIYGDKVRNQSTGVVESYSIIGSCTNLKVLIVDDICDGGATFVKLAELLLSSGAKEVNLFVSHGIFSKGLKPLKAAGINRVFTPLGEVSEHQNHISYRTL